MRKVTTEQVLEEIVQPFKIAVAGPEQRFFLIRKIYVGTVNGEVKLNAVFEQRGQPLFHGMAAPGRDSPFVDRQAFVRNHQVFVYTQHLTKALAGAAGTVGIIEGEEVDAGLFKHHPILLKFIRKEMPFGTFAAHNIHQAAALAFKESGLYRVGDAELQVGAARKSEQLLHQVRYPDQKGLNIHVPGARQW